MFKKFNPFEFFGPKNLPAIIAPLKKMVDDLAVYSDCKRAEAMRHRAESQHHLDQAKSAEFDLTSAATIRGRIEGLISAH